MIDKTLVIDTNVLVSVCIFPDSVQSLLLENARQRSVLLSTTETFNELASTLIRKKFDKYTSLEFRREFIEKLKKDTKFLPLKSDEVRCRDANDEKFLKLALEGKADFLITGDNDLLSMKQINDIPIMSAKDFLSKNLQSSNLVNEPSSTYKTEIPYITIRDAKSQLDKWFSCG